MRYVPFTIYFELFPNEPGTRTENTYELKKISTLIYDSIDNISSINLAKPGSGQQMVSTYANGLATAPRFGDKPARLMITGFNHVVSDQNPAPEPDMTIIANGQTWTGYGGPHHFDSNPNAAVATEVKNLKSTIESAINVGLPDVYEYNVFSIEYNGIRWGIGGFHFPQ